MAKTLSSPSPPKLLSRTTEVCLGELAVPKPYIMRVLRCPPQLDVLNPLPPISTIATEQNNRSMSGRAGRHETLHHRSFWMTTSTRCPQPSPSHLYPSNYLEKSVHTLDTPPQPLPRTLPAYLPLNICPGPTCLSIATSPGLLSQNIAAESKSCLVMTQVCT